MPGKSGRRRQVARSKRRKGRRSPVAMVAPQPTAVPTQETTARLKVSSPTASVSTPRVAPTPLRYPHVADELRRIGIIAGIILVILVVLAWILS